MFTLLVSIFCEASCNNFNNLILKANIINIKNLISIIVYVNFITNIIYAINNTNIILKL